MPLSETRMQQLLQKSVECAPYNDSDHFTILQENTTDADVSGRGYWQRLRCPSQPMRRKRQSKRCMIRQQFAVALSLTCCRSMIIPSRSTRTTPTMCSTRPAISTKRRFAPMTGLRMRAKMSEISAQPRVSVLGAAFWGPNSVLGASYTQKSVVGISNSGESSPFRETNYEPQLFLGFATDYEFAGWTLRDVEVGFNHDSNGRSDPTSRSWNAPTRLMAQNGNMMVEVKPWYVVGSTDDNPDITKYMGYYQLRIGYQLGDAVLSANQYNWNTGYGGAEVGLSCPMTNTCVSIRRSTAVTASRSSITTSIRPAWVSA